MATLLLRICRWRASLDRIRSYWNAPPWIASTSRTTFDMLEDVLQDHIVTITVRGSKRVRHIVFWT